MAGPPQKKASDLQEVPQAVVKPLQPKQGEVELWWAETLEGRRGLSAELAEMGSYVQSQV